MVAKLKKRLLSGPDDGSTIESDDDFIEKPRSRCSVLCGCLWSCCQRIVYLLLTLGVLAAVGMFVLEQQQSANRHEEYKNNYNLVHVVETEFLNYQRDLVHLGKARLDLFKTFTLPSMQRQGNKNFLWLIWTDPKLSEEAKRQLIGLVKNVPNAVVIGFRRERTLDFRDFCGLVESQVDDVIIAGNRKLLKSYHMASLDRLLLETRLDADDALHRDYIESIQRQASLTIGKSDLSSDYRVFCPEHHVEWRYYSPKPGESQRALAAGEEKETNGHLVHYHNPSFCINSGLTIGYQRKAKARHLNTQEQCNMNRWYEECLAEGGDGTSIERIPGTEYIHHYCISRVEMIKNQNDQAVLVSRTPTSAGMKRVLGTEKSYKETFESEDAQKGAWDLMNEKFGVAKDKVIDIRRRMEDNIYNILQDALDGQCMPGHSCKEVTKRKLLRLIKRVSQSASHSD